MKSIVRVTCFASFLTISTLALAQAVGIQTIGQHQADVLLAVLRGKVSPLTLSGQMPPLPPGALEPIMATSGIHCVLPDDGERYFSVQYVVGTGQDARRTVFAFTLSSAATNEQGATDIVGLLNSGKVTQYQVWHASGPPGHERSTESGVVVDFVSRTPSRCVPLR